MYKEICGFIKELYPKENPIPIHAPRFLGKEKEYLLEAIDSTYVSSVGKYVNKFEDLLKDYTGSRYAIPTVNGTAALHLALLLSGLKQGEEAITQAITFVATCNAIRYCGAEPVFCDIDKVTLGLSPQSLDNFLKNNTTIKSDGYCYNKKTNKKISVCVPMHTFGHPTRIEETKEICDRHNIILVEDAAESIGSKYNGKHTGTFGKLGVLSFNGNKTITSGGGGAIVTNDEKLGILGKHLSTTAKIPHKWEYKHDFLSYNYRMPNINAALACAQLEQIDNFTNNKRQVANDYKNFFASIGIEFVSEPKNSFSNYWLNAIIFENKAKRDEFLQYTNDNGVMTRPVWTMMNKLEMYKNCQASDLSNSEYIEERLVNLPSSVKI